MSEQALRDEVQLLREQVARLEAARPADMEGFRQLNDAIVDNRLGAFVREKAQPKWVTKTIAFMVFAPLVIIGLIIIYALGAEGGGAHAVDNVVQSIWDKTK